jgi:diacylglycerol kinase (ATP)
MPVIENKDILFIINPNSGSKKVSMLINKIQSIDSDISLVTTYTLADLEETFKLNIVRFKVFIVVGGDGTVNKAIQYLLNRNDKILGVFPAGSGNGFSNELGFTKNLQSLLSDARRGESLNVDILSVNNKNFINIAGIGFDSYVAHQFQNSKSRGLKNYILTTIKSVFTFKPFNATVNIDDKMIKGKFHMISVANLRQFGNNALISPLSKPNDGIFEVVLVKPFPFYFYPVFVVRLFTGSLKNSKYISYIDVRNRVEIDSDLKKYHIDGEPKVFEKKLKIKMLENKLRVLKTSKNKLKS